MMMIIIIYIVWWNCIQLWFSISQFLYHSTAIVRGIGQEYR